MIKVKLQIKLIIKKNQFFQLKILTFITILANAPNNRVAGKVFVFASTLKKAVIAVRPGRTN